MLKSPWELFLTKPVPEVVKFRSADWAEIYFSAQSARSSSQVTLSPSYTKQSSLSIDILAWPIQRNGKVVMKSFKKKKVNEAEEIANLNMGLGTNTLPSIFSADLSKEYCTFL